MPMKTNPKKLRVHKEFHLDYAKQLLFMVTVCVRPAAHTAPTHWMWVHLRSHRPPGLAKNVTHITL